MLRVREGEGKNLEGADEAGGDTGAAKHGAEELCPEIPRACELLGSRDEVVF